MAVGLAEAKAHIRVESDFEDAQVGQYIAAAEDHLASIGVDMTVDPRPAAIDQAVLLLIGHFFSYREASGDVALKPVPYGVNRLVAPYRESLA